jgi:hypothetical protein
MELFIGWLESLEWRRLIPEILGKGLGFLAGFAVSWFLLFRRRLNALQRLQSGDSDDFIFQMHCLQPIPGRPDETVLLFRNLAPKTTLHELYDNVAARELVKSLAERTSLGDPILKTEGTLGFEILNDAMGHIAGWLAVTPFERRTWLFAMTCEDRQVVRKKCVRCFLIRPEDLDRFADWDWCRDKVRIERPWHWFRVVALHRIACTRREEQLAARDRGEKGRESEMPLVDKQLRHDRIRPLSLGICIDEQSVEEPQEIGWKSHLPMLDKLGLVLPAEPDRELTQAPD